jgi:hypothetical protein
VTGGAGVVLLLQACPVYQGVVEVVCELVERVDLECPASDYVEHLEQRRGRGSRSWCRAMVQNYSTMVEAEDRKSGRSLVGRLTHHVLRMPGEEGEEGFW